MQQSGKHGVTQFVAYLSLTTSFLILSDCLPAVKKNGIGNAINVGEKLQYIEIAETDFDDTEMLKKFLLLTYGAVHLLLQNKERHFNSAKGSKANKEPRAVRKV